MSVGHEVVLRSADKILAYGSPPPSSLSVCQSSSSNTNGDAAQPGADNEDEMANDGLAIRPYVTIQVT